jgi:hypothetical protein
VKVPISRGTVPPGGRVRYRDPDTGFEISHPYYEQVKARARKHRVERGLPIPHDWDDWFDQVMCESTPSACRDMGTVTEEKEPSLVQMAKNFTSSMINWAQQGFPVSSYDLYRERHVKCAGDENNPRCPSFSRFAGTGIAKCGRCGCTSLKLWVQSEKCPLGKW